MMKHALAPCRAASSKRKARPVRAIISAADSGGDCSRIATKAAVALDRGRGDRLAQNEPVFPFAVEALRTVHFRRTIQKRDGFLLHSAERLCNGGCVTGGRTWPMGQSSTL